MSPKEIAFLFIQAIGFSPLEVEGNKTLPFETAQKIALDIMETIENGFDFNAVKEELKNYKL